MGQLIMDFTGPVLGWAWSAWARAGLGRELVSPWRTLLGNREGPGASPRTILSPYNFHVLGGTGGGGMSKKMSPFDRHWAVF